MDSTANAGHAVRRIDSRYAAGCFSSDKDFPSNYYRKDGDSTDAFLTPDLRGAVLTAKAAQRPQNSVAPGECNCYHHCALRAAASGAADFCGE